MHELSIAMSILDMVAEESAKRRAHVVGVHLKLGPLAGVVKTALLSAYDLAREGNALEDARLLIEDVSLVVHCETCRSNQPAVSVQELACAVCGAPSYDVVQGRELEVVALEIQ
jgi:hydrogenase nickel incorporation protein HypA/HybF